MSSPIHHAKDLDAALTYAPPWARDQAGSLTVPLAAAPIALQRSRRSDTGCTFSGDRAALELRAQLAMDPDFVPEPPGTAAQTLRPIVLRLCAVAGAAALVAGAMVSVPGGARLIGNETVQAGFKAMSIAVNRGKQDQARDAAAPASKPDGQAETNQPPSAKIARLENPAGVPAVAVVPPVPAAPPVPAVPAVPAAAPPAPVSQSNPPTAKNASALQLDSEEIATLIKRGEDFLANGDLSSARLLLRRAAEAGSAKAALALGSTFDPLVLQRLGAIGAQPDIDRARQWYQKAAELGSDAASQQLAKLAQARQ
jgi:hypothetical protein